MQDESVLLRLWPYIIGLIFLFLFGLSAYWIMFNARAYTDRLIAHDVLYLQHIFQEIDQTCGIRDFEHDKNVINFLNTNTFIGSQVGPMNLRYPKKWQGPYVKDNPSIQDKDYQIVQATKGYFIAPGDGVHLSNGKIIGTDIVLDEHTNFDLLLEKGGLLRSRENFALAVPLELGVKKDSVKKMPQKGSASDEVMTQVWGISD